MKSVIWWEHKFVCCCLFNYLLQGHQVVKTWHKCSFVAKFGNIWKSTTTLFSKFVWCSTHGHSFMRLSYVNNTLVYLPNCILSNKKQKSSHEGCIMGSYSLLLAGCHQSLVELPWLVYHSSQLSIYSGAWGSMWGIPSFHSAHTAPSAGYWLTWSSCGRPCALYLPPQHISCTVQSLMPHELTWVQSCSRIHTPWAWNDYRRQQWKRWTKETQINF